MFKFRKLTEFYPQVLTLKTEGETILFSYYGEAKEYKGFDKNSIETYAALAYDITRLGVESGAEWFLSACNSLELQKIIGGIPACSRAEFVREISQTPFVHWGDKEFFVKRIILKAIGCGYVPLDEEPKLRHMVFSKEEFDSLSGDLKDYFSDPVDRDAGVKESLGYLEDVLKSESFSKSLETSGLLSLYLEKLKFLKSKHKEVVVAPEPVEQPETNEEPLIPATQGIVILQDLVIGVFFSKAKAAKLSSEALHLFDPEAYMPEEIAKNILADNGPVEGTEFIAVEVAKAILANEELKSKIKELGLSNAFDEALEYFDGQGYLLTVSTDMELNDNI